MSAEDLVASVLAGFNKECQKMAQKKDYAKQTQEESEQAASRSKGRNAKQAVPKFVVEPRTISVVKKPKSYMNHSYRDCSNVPPELNDVVPTEIADMTFAQKVHHILSNKEYKPYISWLPHGRSFKIHIPKRMEQLGILSKYFGHSRFSTFLRQLNNHGFKHITKGTDRNSYYHECMLRGLPHLCKYMPEPKDARRLIPDPDNEPDFYAISKLYPLPDDKPEEADTKKQADAQPPRLSGVSRPALELPWELEGAPARNRARLDVPRTVAAAATVASAPTVASVAQPSPIVDPAILQLLRSAAGLAATSPFVDVSALQSALLRQQATLHLAPTAVSGGQQQLNTTSPAVNSAIIAYLRSVNSGGSSGFGAYGRP